MRYEYHRPLTEMPSVSEKCPRFAHRSEIRRTSVGNVERIRDVARRCLATQRKGHASS
jgi:hypothetical protein